MALAKARTTTMSRRGHRSARWTTREDAKRSSRKRRRREDRRQARDR